MKRSPYPKKAQFAVLVIDTFELRRAGVVSLLKPWAENNGMRVVEFDPHAALLESPPDSSEPPFKLILLVIGAAGVSDPEPHSWIRSLAGRYAGVPLVVVSDREDSSEVVSALEVGVRGFIPSSTALSVATQALTFIVSGGSFFPPAALTRAALVDQQPRRGIAVVATASVNNSALTARQKEVLEQLQQGASNKVIGRRLKLRESTVKVHIRHIMRKLGAVNRTQAALSAVHLQVSSAVSKAALRQEQDEGEEDDEVKDGRPSQPRGPVLELAAASPGRPVLLSGQDHRARLFVKSGLRPTSR